MDDKMLTSMAGLMALLTIQINTLMAVIANPKPGLTLQDHFLELTAKAWKSVGAEVTESVKQKLREGVVIQELRDLGLDDLWKAPGSGSA
jgi:hypothetical protein